MSPDTHGPDPAAELGNSADDLGEQDPTTPAVGHADATRRVRSGGGDYTESSDLRASDDAVPNR